MKYCQKIAISKHFLISLMFVVLIFTAFGVCMEDACAVDLNQNVSEIGNDLNIEDKIGNSHENVLGSNLNEEDVVSVSQNNEVLGTTYELLNGGTFAKIREKVALAQPGDTIKLSGYFRAEKENDHIIIDKRLNIVSDSFANLNGKGITHILVLHDGAAGSTIENLTFVNAYRNSLAGAIHIMARNVHIKGCTFRNNTAYKGGAIATLYNSVDAANLVIEDCKFIRNHATAAAGAVAAHGDNTWIKNCIFDSNGVSSDIEEYIYGGAIQIGLMDEVSRGYVNNCKFMNNYVESIHTRSHGGAGCVRDGIQYKNCIFINNSAAQGGALTYHASGLIKNCTFINNSAIYYGGALSTGFSYNEMDLDIEKCNFEGNVAPIGGAVQLNGLNITIKNCNFNKNNASEIGGAININAENVVIQSSGFDDNVANVDGGAVYIKGKNTLIKDSSFISNDAIPDKAKLDDGLGGAIYINSTEAIVENNEFYFNTARNGSAIYYDKYGTKLKLVGNTLYQNQAWVYLLPVYAKDIYYGEAEKISSVIHGGNNIAEYGNLAVSNAIYNAADNRYIEIDGQTPVLGATTSGHLYQDDREYNMEILLTVEHEDGTVVYNNTLNSNCFGEVSSILNNLKVGNYVVTARHFEDTYYKAITNTTTFKVTAQVDDKIRKSVSSDDINYEDVVIWTLNITNNGPSNATGIVVRDVLPEGLIYLEDDTGGKYNPVTGVLTIGSLKVGEVIIVNIKTLVNKTGEIVNKANVTANEYDYNLTNNHDQSKVDVNPACDLAVKKVVNASVVNIGDLVKWTVTVSNLGPDGATGVVVRDLLPDSLIFVESSGNYNRDTGVWTIGNLNKGASVSLDITCRVNATGLIENEVSVSGNEYDYDESNNYAFEVIDVNLASDLAITKLVDRNVVNYLDVVKWTLIVTNKGPDAATGVKVYDALPRGFVYLNSTRPLVNNEIEIGNLAVGGSVNVDIYTKVDITGSFVNVATVSGNEFDQDLSNNRAEVPILVKPATDLVVEKSVNESTPNLGDLVKWTITVSNLGPDGATGVVVRDLLPDSLIFVESSGNYNRDTGVWTIGNLNKGASVSLDITCRVNATGLIENEVSVSGNEYDYDESNNYAFEVIDVNLASDLAITKLVDRNVVNYLDVVKWTLIVTNKGPDAATGVKVYDALPRGFVYLNSTRPLVNDEIEIGNLAVGGTLRVDIYTKVNITGSFVNVASVSGNEFDQDLSNNKANASILVKPATDLMVKKSSNASTFNLGDLVRWTITVSNLGPDGATGVVVRDLLPDSLIFVESSGNYNRDTGVWTIGNLNKGASVSLDITCRVNATGLIENEVSVSGNEYDYDESNNYAFEVIDVNLASDLAITKLVDRNVVNYLDVVKWTLIVTNKGPDAATGVKVYDALPRGFVYLNSTRPLVNNVIEIGNLAVGRTVTVDIYTKVNITGSFVNVASVSGNEFDQDLSNNKANASILVNPATDLMVKKSSNASTFNLGDLVRWTITVSNLGPDGATGVVVRDLLPDSLIFVESSGNYNRDTGVWTIGNLNKGASVSLDITCRVNATGLIENEVSVSGNEYDYDESNNYAFEVIDVNLASDLAITKLVDRNVVNYLDVVKWTLIVTNKGPDAATGVKVYDALPRGFVYLNSTRPLVNDEIEIGNLAVGGTLRVDIYTKVNITGSFVNVASVSGNEFDQDLSNNKANASILVKPATDLVVSKVVNQSKPNFGDLVKWAISVFNRGPDSANGVVVNDLLPKSLIWISDNSLDKYDAATGIWNVGTINKGETKTLEIITKVNATGLFTNNVSVSGNEFDYNMSNNQDNETINVSKASDLSVVKFVNSTSVEYLQLVKWTVIAYNNGPDKATEVIVDDILPDGLILLNYTATKGVYDNGMWSVCCIENGDSQSLELICQVNKTGTLTNIVGITGKEYDPDLSNNADNASVFVPTSCDLAIAKTVDNSFPDFGDIVEWHIVVTNNGPDDAFDVTVVDRMPDGLELIESIVSAGSFGENIWYIPNLENGASEYLTLRCLVKTLNDVENIAEVIPSQYDWNKSNNRDDASITINPVADLGIIKFIDEPQANYLDLVKWTLMVFNYGPNDATNVFARDVIPDGLTVVSVTGDGEYFDSIWEIGNLKNGESRRLDIVCKITSTGKFTNVAEVWGDETDPDLYNNDCEEYLFVPPASDLSITKTVSKYTYSVGNMVRYSIKLSNNGPDVAENIEVNEIMDDSLMMQSFKVSAGNFNKLNDVWSLDLLDVGESAFLKINAIAKKSGSARNNVSVTSDNYDPDLSNNDDTVLVNIINDSHKHNYPKNNKTIENDPLGKFSSIILENYRSGNPFAVVLILIVLLMGTFCTSDILKKR